MTRLLCSALLLAILPMSSPFAQVDIADPWESGFGISAGGAFASDVSGLGGSLSYTVKGVIDFGFGFSSLSGDGDGSGTAAGGQITFLPLRTKQPDASWALGGLVGVSSVSSDGSSSQTFTTLGALLSLDIPASRKTDFQLSGIWAYAVDSDTDRNVNIVTISGGFVTKRLKRNFYILGSVSIPSDESYTTFGIDLGFFFKVVPQRGKVN